MQTYTQLTENNLTALAKKIALLLRRQDMLLFYGDFGVGKSTFIRALIRAHLGNPDIEVLSPTYTLVQIYEQCNPNLWHFDLYRIEIEEEVFELGFEEAQATGISFIEWSERLVAFAPSNALQIKISISDAHNKRDIEFKGNTDWQERLKTL